MQNRLMKLNYSLSKQYDELQNLKVNMNDYLGRNKAEKKESVIVILRNIKEK